MKRVREIAHTTPNTMCFIDLTYIKYIGINDTSRFENGGSRLLKIASTTTNLGTHAITTYHNLEVIEALLPIPSLNAYIPSLNAYMT